MTSWYERFMGAADDLSFIVQNAGKSFGFLPDGREHVEVEEGPSGPVVTFVDHADEGWPTLRVGLPGSATFNYAAAGPITRVATWTVDAGLDPVLRELAAHPEVPDFERGTGRRVAIPLGDDAELRVAPHGEGGTGLFLRQRRDPSVVPEVLNRRYDATVGTSGDGRRAR